jgi:hypothetical protein
MKAENHPENNRHDHAHSWIIFFATLCGLCGFAVNPVFFDVSALGGGGRWAWRLQSAAAITAHRVG